MTLRRMDHVGIVVTDLAAAREFFAQLGFVPQGEGSVEGQWVDRIVALKDVDADIAMMQTPDGNSRVELTMFRSPLTDGEGSLVPANEPGIRHLAFVVEDVEAVLTRLRGCGSELVGHLERYQDSYLLCYVRGPAGIIVELAQELG